MYDLQSEWNSESSNVATCKLATIMSNKGGREGPRGANLLAVSTGPHSHTYACSLVSQWDCHGKKGMGRHEERKQNGERIRPVNGSARGPSYSALSIQRIGLPFRGIVQKKGRKGTRKEIMKMDGRGLGRIERGDRRVSKWMRFKGCKLNLASTNEEMACILLIRRDPDCIGRAPTFPDKIALRDTRKVRVASGNFQRRLSSSRDKEEERAPRK